MFRRKWKKLLLIPAALLWTLPLLAGTLMFSTADPAWKFNDGSAEFPPGAQGSVTPGNEFLRLDGNFARGGRHVSAQLPVRAASARELRFKVRTPASRVTVLAGDAEGKIRSIEQPLGGGGAPEFREVAVPLDGKPLTSIGIRLNQNDLRTDDGFVELSGLRLGGVPEEQMTPACRADSPAAHFIAPGGGPLRLALLAGKEKFSPEELRGRCLDYAGKEVSAVAATFDAAARSIAVPVPETPGFYELEFPAAGIRSSVMVAEPYSGIADPFFGLQLPSGTPDGSGWARLLKRSGIGWGSILVSSTPDGGRESDALRQAAAREEIPLLETFSGYSPARDNLVEMARRFATAAARPEGIGAVELGAASDPDLPPEFTIAPVRAVVSRFALDKIPAPVTAGSNAIAPDDPKLSLYRMYLVSGLIDDIDALSFIAPESPRELEERIDAIRNAEKSVRNSRAGIPHWVSGPAGESPAQTVARAAELRALGAAKFFPSAFDSPDKPERAGLSAGAKTAPVPGRLTDANGAPKRQLAVYANLPRVLAFKEYIGDLEIEGTERARVFADGAEAVIVADCAEKINELTLPEALNIRKAAGIDGRPLKIVDNRVPATDKIVFLYPETQGLLKLLNSDTPAMKIRKIARDFKPGTRNVKPLVIQPGRLNRGICDRIGSRVLCGEPIDFQVIYNNLSDQTVTVEPYLNPPGGLRVTEAASMAGQKKFDILPGARQDFNFTLQFDPSLAQRNYITFPVTDRGGKASNLTIPVNPCNRAAVPLALNGTPSGWIDFSAPANWESPLEFPQEIRAKFRVSAWKSGLRFEIEVHGERREPGDGIRLTLQLRRNPDDLSGPVLTFRTGEPARDGFHVAFLRRPEGISRYEIDIPATALNVAALKPGMAAGVHLAAVNGDGDGREKGVLTWGEGGGAKTIPVLFQLLVFKE